MSYNVRQFLVRVAVGLMIGVVFRSIVQLAR